MPTETRVLQFSTNEIVTAMKDYCDQTGRRLPDHGTIVVAEEKIPVSANSDGQYIPVEFSENEVATALMMFCMKQKIPMPRRATKALQISSHSFTLHLEMQ